MSPQMVVGLVLGTLFLSSAAQAFFSPAIVPDGSNRSPNGRPVAWDIAMAVDVAGSTGYFSPPIELKGYAYTVGESTLSLSDNVGLTAPTIFRVDLATGDVSDWFVAPAEDLFAHGLTTDGDGVVFARRSSYVKLETSGNVLWQAEFDAPEGMTIVASMCATPAQIESRLYVSCGIAATPLAFPPIVSDVAGPGIVSVSYDMVGALDAGSGEWIWQRVRSAGDLAGEDAGDATEVASLDRPSHYTGPHQVVASEEIVAVSIVDRQGPLGAIQCGIQNPTGSQRSPPLYQTVWALTPEGATLWEWRAPLPSEPAMSAEGVQRAPILLEQSLRLAPAVFLGKDNVIVKADHLYVLDPASGCVSRQIALFPPAGSQRVATTNILAASTEAIIAGTFEEVVAVSRETYAELWRSKPLLDGETFASEQSPILFDHFLAVTTIGADSFSLTPTNATAAAISGRLLILDVVDGSLVWQYSLDPLTYNPFVRTLGSGEGLLFIESGEGPFVVVGRTPASIRVALSTDDLYPGPGEEFVLDLTGSRAGVLAPDLEFRIDWGDGNATEWTIEPKGTHRYGQASRATILVQARNSAHQVASETLEVFVGEQPPRVRGFVEEAFAPENQERTYFVLGLGATFILSIGGLIFPLNKAKARIFGGAGVPKTPTKSRRQKQK